MAPTRLKAKSPSLSTRRRPKILEYGKAGVGKTWGALDFPSSYYIDTEGGAKEPEYTKKLLDAGAGYMGPEDGACDLQEIANQLKALATEKHDYRTVIIDSISKPWNTAIGEEQERLGADDAYGASKKRPVAAMRQIVRWIDRVDMNVILVAHAKAEYGMVGGKNEQIGYTFDAWEKLEYELELALQIEKVGPKRTMRVRKSRVKEFEEGKVYEWSYDSFAKLYGREAIEGETQVVTLATAQQVTEIRRLIELMKVSDEDQKKALDKRGAETYEDLSEADAADMLENLNRKVAGKRRLNGEHMQTTPKTRKEINDEALWPKGIYGFEVVSAEEKTSSKGNEMIEIQLVVSDDQNRTRKLRDWIMDAMPEKQLNFCEAGGLMKQYESGNISARDCIGVTGYLKLVIQEDKTGQYPAKNSVANYVPPVDERQQELVGVGASKKSAFVPRSNGAGPAPFAPVDDDSVPF